MFWRFPIIGWFCFPTVPRKLISWFSHFLSYPGWLTITCFVSRTFGTLIVTLLRVVYNQIKFKRNLKNWWVHLQLVYIYADIRYLTRIKARLFHTSLTTTLWFFVTFFPLKVVKIWPEMSLQLCCHIFLSCRRQKYVNKVTKYIRAR